MPLKLTVARVLVLSAFLPVVSLAAALPSALAPIRNATSPYAGGTGEPFAGVQKIMRDVTDSVEATPKDLVVFTGYDETLFSAFQKLLAKRTQVVDFTACADIGLPPRHERKITKGSTGATDYASDSFTDLERADIAKVDSRVLRYSLIPTDKGITELGTTQYIDFNNGFRASPSAAEGQTLRMGTLKHPIRRKLDFTQCTHLPSSDAVFPDSILRETAVAPAPSSFEDNYGVRWSVRKGSVANKWLASGPNHLSTAGAIALYENRLAALIQKGHKPWHVSRTETFRGKALAQRIQFAKFDYEGGRTETMTLLVAEGKARLGWSVIDTSESLVAVPLAAPLSSTQGTPDTAAVANTAALGATAATASTAASEASATSTAAASATPASPATVSARAPKKSFEEYAAKFTPRGSAALHLLQISVGCPDTAVAKKIDEARASSWVLYEATGSTHLTSAQLKAIPAAKFKERATAGVELLQDLEETDIATAVDCTVNPSKVDEWSAKLDNPTPEFLVFVSKMTSIK